MNVWTCIACLHIGAVGYCAFVGIEVWDLLAAAALAYATAGLGTACSRAMNRTN